MQVADKGQVTIPKHIRIAAGVLPGSEVTVLLATMSCARPRSLIMPTAARPPLPLTNSPAAAFFSAVALGTPRKVKIDLSL